MAWRGRQEQEAVGADQSGCVASYHKAFRERPEQERVCLYDYYKLTGFANYLINKYLHMRSKGAATNNKKRMIVIYLSRSAGGRSCVIRPPVIIYHVSQLTLSRERFFGSKQIPVVVIIITLNLRHGKKLCMISDRCSDNRNIIHPTMLIDLS